MDASAARMNSGTRDLREPYIRTHFTDMMSPMFTQQTHPYCKDFDLKLRYCLEAYGKPMAYTKCKDIEEDLHECLHRGKQVCETFSFNSYLHSFHSLKFFMFSRLVDFWRWKMNANVSIKLANVPRKDTTPRLPNQIASN